LGQCHPLPQGFFALLLQPEIERQLEVVAGHRLHRRDRHAWRHRFTGGVDLDALLTRRAAQIMVVVVLHAALANDRSRLDSAERRFLQLFSGDLADIAEHLSAQFVVCVVADRDGFLYHAGELVLALADLGQHAASGVGLDRDVGVRCGGDPLYRAFVDRARAEPDHPAQTVE
jgi:hypothetical protein